MRAFALCRRGAMVRARRNALWFMRASLSAVLLRGVLLVVVMFAAMPSVAADRYPSVRPGVLLQFPLDTGAHPEFRTEWWYITGWLEDETGTLRGFQLTFFRVRTLIGEDNPGMLAPRQLLLAHAAVADPAIGRLLHAERAERAVPGLAGAATSRTEVFVRDWYLQLDDEGRYRTRVAADDFEYELTFVPDGDPVLNGRGGFSQKTADPINASYYYSRPQLAVTGRLVLGGRTLAVRGHAWLDHEWSSEILPAEASGWDWVGINLHDGGSLMAFQMRDHQRRPLWTAGTLRSADGTVNTLAPGQVGFEAGRRWRSPRTGAEYPVEWQIEADGRRFSLRPLMDDQELDSRATTGAVYWEGAVRLFENDAEVGQGYLEMTGYRERLRM